MSRKNFYKMLFFYLKGWKFRFFNELLSTRFLQQINYYLMPRVNFEQKITFLTWVISYIYLYLKESFLLVGFPNPSVGEYPWFGEGASRPISKDIQTQISEKYKSYITGNKNIFCNKIALKVIFTSSHRKLHSGTLLWALIMGKVKVLATLLFFSPWD